MKCQLCNSEKRDDLNYGEFLTKNGKGVHTYCLYLTSNLTQNGKDEDGFLGFLVNDIVTERHRVAKQRCCYCGTEFANISCCKTRCHRTFHLICGLEAGVKFQFIHTYRSFCDRHVPKVHQRPYGDEKCCICYERLIGEGKRFKAVNMLQAPCCRNGWFHRICLQRFSNTAGYFFKCPLCNDKEYFKQRMAFNGVFIQDRDAEWELEPHAYEDLLERPNVCKAQICHNLIGRGEDDKRDPLMLCRLCGSEAIHKHCLTSNVKHFECNSCQNILDAHNKSDINDKEQNDSQCSLDADDSEDEIINVEYDSDENDSNGERKYFVSSVLKAIDEIAKKREQNKQNQMSHEEGPSTSSAYELRSTRSTVSAKKDCLNKSGTETMSPTCLPRINNGKSITSKIDLNLTKSSNSVNQEREVCFEGQPASADHTRKGYLEEKDSHRINAIAISSNQPVKKNLAKNSLGQLYDAKNTKTQMPAARLCNVDTDSDSDSDVQPVVCRGKRKSYRLRLFSTSSSDSESREKSNDRDEKKTINEDSTPHKLKYTRSSPQNANKNKFDSIASSSAQNNKSYINYITQVKRNKFDDNINPIQNYEAQLNPLWDTSAVYYPLSDILEEESSMEEFDSSTSMGSSEKRTEKLCKSTVKQIDKIASRQPYSSKATATPTSSAATTAKCVPRRILRRRVLTSRYNVDPYIIPKYTRVNGKLKRVYSESEKTCAQRYFSRSYHFLLDATKERVQQ